MIKLLSICFVAGLLVSGAELAGKWKGEVSRADGTVQTVVLELKQSGDGITGSIGESEGSEMRPVQNAKQDGEKLTFDVPTGAAVFKVSLSAEGDAMKGTVVRTRDGNASPPLAIAFKRQK